MAPGFNLQDIYPPSTPPEKVDVSLLLTLSIADHLLQSRRLLHRPPPPLRGAAMRTFLLKHEVSPPTPALPEEDLTSSDIGCSTSKEKKSR
ncbi:hypothetical protein QYF36_025465 [Acer negundo]|nr:hypothetical protein QYF36_025465 [Acer negundo]